MDRQVVIYDEPVETLVPADTATNGRAGACTRSNRC